MVKISAQYFEVLILTTPLYLTLTHVLIPLPTGESKFPFSWHRHPIPSVSPKPTEPHPAWDEPISQSPSVDPPILKSPQFHNLISPRNTPQPPCPQKLTATSIQGSDSPSKGHITISQQHLTSPQTPYQSTYLT